MMKGLRRGLESILDQIKKAGCSLGYKSLNMRKQDVLEISDNSNIMIIIFLGNNCQENVLKQIWYFQ